MQVNGSTTCNSSHDQFIGNTAGHGSVDVSEGGAIFVDVVHGKYVGFHTAYSKTTLPYMEVQLQ